jgi:hypothetical protein
VVEVGLREPHWPGLLLNWLHPNVVELDMSFDAESIVI